MTHSIRSKSQMTLIAELIPSQRPPLNSHPDKQYNHKKQKPNDRFALTFDSETAMALSSTACRKQI